MTFWASRFFPAHAPSDLAYIGTIAVFPKRRPIYLAVPEFFTRACCKLRRYSVPNRAKLRHSTGLDRAVFLVPKHPTAGPYRSRTPQISCSAPSVRPIHGTLVGYLHRSVRPGITSFPHERSSSKDHACVAHGRRDGHNPRALRYSIYLIRMISKMRLPLNFNDPKANSRFLA